jgi:type IV secretion system protein VirB2
VNPDGTPADTNAFAAAAQWLEGTLLGTVATAVAVIAVASVGLLLMSGRVDLRRAVQVIIGCFILFGASILASGIVNVVTGTTGSVAEPTPPPPTPVYSAPAPKTAPASAPYDPYAGAALPTRR